MPPSPTLLRRLQHPVDVIAVSAGLLAGLFLVCGATPLRLILGTNPEVDAAMVLTAAICCWLSRTWKVIPGRTSQLLQFALPAAATWTLISPVLLRLCVRAISGISLNSLGIEVVAYGVMFLITFLCLAPIILAARLSHYAMGGRSAAAQWQWLLGLGAACLILPTLVLPYAGTTVLSWIGAVLSLLWLSSLHWLGGQTSDQEAIPARPGMAVGWFPSLVSIMTGGALALTAFIAGQLIPRNLTGDLALFAGLVLGLGCALARRHWQVAGSVGLSASLVCLWLAAWTGILAAGYPLWTRFCLQMNALVESMSVLFALRVALLIGLILPAGFIIRRLSERNDSSSLSAINPMLIALGFIAAPWLPCPPHLLACGIGIVALLLALIAWSGENFQFPSRLSQKIGTAGLAGAALCGILFSGNLRPEQSEKILFSTQTLQSYRQGTDPRKLNWIDEGRSLARFTSLADHLSLWKYRGSQIVLRRNGMVTGIHSSQPSLSPHHAGDLLPMLMPLALHPDPAHVLVLGVHPPSLLTCHAWPLQTVKTVDGSAMAFDMLHWLTDTAAHRLHLQNGPEFQFARVDPLLSLYCRHDQKYDLIACPLLHPSSVGADSRLTREFYRAVRSQLDAGGIFSQRIPYYDLGPVVVREMIATMQSEFDEISVMESAPGELIFLCSPSHLPPIDDDFVERLKLPQSRRLLAQAGWDWSLVLGRGGLTPEGLSELCKPGTHINRSGSSRLAYWMPIEVSRWGAKSEATRKMLADHGRALRTALGETAGAKEVTERLEDLNLAHQIQRENPNEPWAYRAALKSRLQERPRTTIARVNHQLRRVMDPEDEQRKKYLLALGPTAQTPHPSPAQILQLTNFLEPYDPLVSMFIHYETANLYSRSEPTAPEFRLSHLLHTIYFATGYDQSVRNIIDALHLLCEDPGNSLSPSERWDEVNSLMQVLAQRWHLRLNGDQVSKYEVLDTQYSLQAAEAALKLLAVDHAAAGLTPADWELRKAALEEILMRPLYQHHSEEVRQVRSLPPLPKKST